MPLVSFYAAARAASGCSSMECQPSTLGELITNLSDLNSNLRDLLPTCSFLLNSVACDEFDVKLESTDRMDVLPQFSGG